MSGHSPEQEAATYAGQANMGGVESLDRSTFRKVSEIFNAFVFGSEAPAPAPAPAQAPAPLPSLSATSEALQADNLDAFAFYSRPYPGPGGAFKPPQYCTAAENAAPKNCRPSPSLHSSSLPVLLHSKQPATPPVSQQTLPALLHSKQPATPTSLPSLSVTSEAVSTAPQATEAAKELAALADFPSHNSSDQIDDFPLAPTLLFGDVGVYGVDLFESSADHAPCPCAPRGGISPAVVNETPRTNAHHHPIPASVDPTSFSSTKAEVLATLKRNQICLLHQKPGFGKTRIIMELLSKNSFLIIFVPTKVLRAQVTALTAISYTNHF